MVSYNLQANPQKSTQCTHAYFILLLLLLLVVVVVEVKVIFKEISLFFMHAS